MARYTDRIVSLERVRARDLVPHAANWRQHPDSQVSALRGLLSEVGWASALLAYRSNGHLRLIDGHLRAGLDPDEQVPVLILDVDDAEAEKLLVSIDPLAAMAQANGEALRGLLERVETSDAGLQAMLSDLNAQAAPKQGRTDPDDVPEDVEPRTKPGDLWLLGEHRLLCGDATDAADVDRVLGGGVPNLMVTDPPYGVSYDPAWRQRAAEEGHLAYSARRVGEVPNDDRSDWSEAFVLFPGDVIYCWSPPGSSSYLFHDALVGSGYDIRMQIIWSKPHFPISRGHYHVRHEPCWYAVRKGHDAGWVGDRKQTTVWEDTLDKNVAGGHSTQKPVALMRRPLENHAGDVFDPFVGSGTTVIAAEQVARRCFAMDVEPRYCDVTVARWEAFTGETAQLGVHP